MECLNCKKNYKDQKSLDRHKKTGLHQQMSNPRFCIACRNPIDKDSPSYVIRCKYCYIKNQIVKPFVLDSDSMNEELIEMNEDGTITTSII